MTVLRWLAIVGIGEDGLDGLPPAARRVLSQAELVVGGARHLALAGPLGAETLAWPSPISDAFPTILGRRGRPVCVLATGDPFLYGIGSVLAQHVPAHEIICHPGPGAFSLAAARLGWALQDCDLVSLHGRTFERILPRLQPGARLLVLAWDGTTPEKLARLLAARGMGRSRLVVCEAMGGPRERLRETTAQSFDLADVDPLNTIGLEIEAERGAPVLSLAPGLADDLFEHDGQITRREVRALTLSALAPRQGELLWDVGAGSGSVGIEWMLAHSSNRAIAVEARADRAARVARNALAFGVPDLRVVEGHAPAALDDLPAPDAIFVGGGATTPGLLDAVWAVLRPRGRIVVNAVTIETQAELSRRLGELGGSLTWIQIARAEPVGGFFGFKPAMPVVQWAATKP